MSFSVVIFPTSLGMLPVKLFHMKSLEKEHFAQVSKHIGWVPNGTTTRALWRKEEF